MKNQLSRQGIGPEPKDTRRGGHHLPLPSQLLRKIKRIEARLARVDSRTYARVFRRDKTVERTRIAAMKWATLLDSERGTMIRLRRIVSQAAAGKYLLYLSRAESLKLRNILRRSRG